MLILTYIICVFSGFTLRVCLEYKAETFTFKYIVLRAIITTCVAFASIIIYRDYKKLITISEELYLFLIGFFAVFFITLFDKISQVGIKVYLRVLLKRILAYTEPTDTKEKRG